jgi:hypothetical protein
VAKASLFSVFDVRAEALTHNPELRLISGTGHQRAVEKVIYAVMPSKVRNLSIPLFEMSRLC